MLGYSSSSSLVYEGNLDNKYDKGIKAKNTAFIQIKLKAIIPTKIWAFLVISKKSKTHANI
jgi:hypothetical protein